MIIECPRCGFSQPKDKYCANCGIDIDSFEQKPPGFLTRTLNSPNVHLALIVSLIIGTVFYLMVAQRELISNEVTRIFNGLPVLSQDASEEGQPLADFESIPMKTQSAEPSAPKEAQGFIEPSAATRQDPKVAGPPIVEVKYIEISKENIRALTTVGQLVRELNDWRVVFVPSSQSVQGLLNSSRRLPGDAKRALPQGGDFEILSGDVDPDPQSPFMNFSMIWTMPNAVEWALITQLPNPDPQANPRLQLVEHQGEMTWDPQGALFLIFDPLQRIPIADNTPLQQSPLSVLRSADFRSGNSALVIWIELTNKPALF